MEQSAGTAGIHFYIFCRTNYVPTIENVAMRLSGQHPASIDSASEDMRLITEDLQSISDLLIFSHYFNLRLVVTKVEE